MSMQDEITRKAVQAALNVIDESTLGATNKSEGPCGDKLAAELHKVISAALSKVSPGIKGRQ